MKHALALVLALCTSADLFAAAKPVLAVFPFTSQFDRGKMGRIVTKSLRRKFEKKWMYTAIDDMSVNDMVEGADIKIAFDTPPVKIGEFAKSALAADIVVWGKVERAAGGFRILARAMNLTDGGKALPDDLAQDCPSVRHVPLASQKIVDAVSGDQSSRGREPTVPEARRRKEPRPNLAKNGAFEVGSRWQPEGWQQVNNMTTFYVAEGKPGKCIKIDTDVYEREVLPWLKRIEQGADPGGAPKKTITSGHKYDTIGGTYGVQFYSDPIPINPGMVYRISVDMKGHYVGIFFPKVFLKGYDRFVDPELGPQDREMYRSYLACRCVTKGKEWEFFTRTFLPTGYLVVYDFRSDFDQNRMGKRVAELVRQKAEKVHKFPMIPLKIQQRVCKERKFFVDWDMPVAQIQYFTREKLKGHAAVWGRVTKAGDGSMKLEVRVTDTRQKRLQPLLDLAYSFRETPQLDAACSKFTAALRKKIRFVQYVKVMLYAYWPPFTYHFENVRLTEEGEALW